MTALSETLCSVDASFTWGWNFFKETPTTNDVQIIDNTPNRGGPARFV